LKTISKEFFRPLRASPAVGMPNKNNLFWRNE